MAAKKKQAQVIELEHQPVDLDAMAEKVGSHPPKRVFRITGKTVKDYPAGEVKQVHVDPAIIAHNRDEWNYGNVKKPPLVVRVAGKPDVRAWEVEFLDGTTLRYSQEKPLVKDKSVGCDVVAGTVAWIETTGEVRAVTER